MNSQYHKTTFSQSTIHLHIESGRSDALDYQFTESFRIGRGNDNQVTVLDGVVSRQHTEVVYLDDRWWLQDLGSGNGTLVNGRKVERTPLADGDRIELGAGGPAINIHIQAPAAPVAPVAPVDERPDPSLTYIKDHYLSPAKNDSAGARTMMVRRAFDQVRRKQKSRYMLIIGVVALLLVVTGGYAAYKHFEVKKQRRLAEDIFYNMKALELEFAEVLRIARKEKDKDTLARLNKYRSMRKDLEENYNRFIDTLKVYQKRISPEERLVLRVSRLFGECEVNMPPGFVREVMKYVQKWKSTGRLKKAIARADRLGYTAQIAKTLKTHDLPPQFFYLALQESNFNSAACGPRTRWGIAKGMWQFIPETARRYGLRTGPLVKERKPDPKDERLDPQKASVAAAKYLRDIYDTDAQASGLLVMASYNWGENRVNRLIGELPETPRERNFWNLLLKYRDKIPKQTYDYVFYIVSAAVIGENPQLFGFDFDNPLAAV